MNPTATINIKDFGKITISLDAKNATNTVNNFIEIALNNDYNNSTFHRVINNFMIQGGITNKKYSPIRGEFTHNGFNNPLLHKRGVISMARLGSSNDSATSQFFIVHKDSPHLDGQYASFGEVIEGLDILDKIAKVRVDHYDKPIVDVIIDNVEINLNGYTPNNTVRL